MRTRKVKASELEDAIREDLVKLQHRLDTARRRAAQHTAMHVRRNVPVAFSELRDSVHVNDATVVADAPHAAPVEFGSRPHWPPIEPIIRWVKLRGSQGLTGASMGHLPGTTTPAHATAVAGAIAKMGDGSVTPIDAPERIAWAIAAKIAKNGTKPAFYMGAAVPVALDALRNEVNAALEDF